MRTATQWAIVAMLAGSMSVTGLEGAADEVAAARRQILGTIPATLPGAFEETRTPDGRHVYEATSARPLIDSVKLDVAADRIVKGLTTVSAQKAFLLGRPNLSGLYWRMKAITPGPYWVGVAYRSDSGGLEAPQGGSVRFEVYLNGRQLPCTRMSDPVQVAPGAWVAEAQAAEGTALKEGDEIAVVSRGGQMEVVRLTLHASAPRLGAHRWVQNPGPNAFCPATSLGITVEPSFLPASGKPLLPNFSDPYFGTEQWLESVADVMRDAGGKALAQAILSNPLPVPVELRFEAVMRGYYLREAGRVSKTLTLAPHAQVALEIPFETNADEPAYSLSARVEAVRPPDLGWPLYDELAFFDGLRHLVPWENPFAYQAHLRVNFRHHRGAERGRLTLQRDSAWEGAFTTNGVPPMPPPPDLKFTPRVVPPIYARYGNDNEPDARAFYVRRKFVMPDRPAGRHYRLVVDSISSEGTAYINGRRVGHVRGFNTPLIGDATEALRAGENEVTLVVRGKRAITNPEYGNPHSPTESNGYLDAPGDCNAQFAMHGGVWLEITPDVEVQGLKVDTSVRKRTVAAKFSLINRRSEALRLAVDVNVGDGRATVLSLGRREVSLKPGAEQEFEFLRDWKDAKLWSWNEPNLYVMSVEVKDVDSGERIDLARARFGFRETWMQADTLFFNGHPVRLKGGGATLPLAGKGYSQLGRGAVAPDFSDEVGSLVTELVTGLVNTPSKHNVERDVFWEATEANALKGIRRKWNHPSIIAWDLSNEWFTYAPYTGCDMNQCAGRFLKLSGAAERLDPSRWTFFNGDYDIGGRHYNVSAHYMLGAARFGYEFDGHSVYLPDGAFLRPLDGDYRPGQELLINAHQNMKYTMGSKVLMDNENLWKVGEYMPPGTSRFMGEEAVLAPFMDENAGPMIWMWKQDFDAHRDMNMAILCNHDSKPGTVTRGHLLQTFIMPDVVHHAFSGRTLTRHYSLLNDIFRAAAMSFRWRLVGPDGTAVREGAGEREMAPAETWRSVLSFTAPDVAARTRFTLELRLHADGEFVCGEDRDIDVWPDTPVAVGPLSRKVFLFDRTGKTADALKAASCTFEKLETLAAPKGGPGQAVVVIGEGALDAVSAKDVAGLAAFADEGGRILVLAQTVTPQGLPARVGLESREWTSQPYVRLPIHPVLNGLREWDLHFWAPDRVSSRGAYNKPFGASCVPLVDSGDRDGLEWVQMMELYRGRGMYFLCQFPLVGNDRDEPLARELLARTLRYLGGRDAFRAPVRALELIAPESSSIERALKALRIGYERVSPQGTATPDAPCLFEAGAIPEAGTVSALKQRLTAGGTVVVAGTRPADAGWIESLAGKPVRITVPRYRMWEGRGYRDGYHPLTAGLSQLDLFWKKYFWNGHTSEDPEYLIEQFQTASVDVPGARELVFPGALVEVPVGAGRLILDQRRWTVEHPNVVGLAKRNLAALALGLNVAMAPVPPKPELPPEAVLRPIVLSPYANRALYDDVAEDGRGGWSDQGPDADFRAFPTGEQEFDGVPFLIGSGAKSIVVLASENRPARDNLHFEVFVPVGERVEGFYFLHSAAYSGGEVGAYRIQYEDGSTLDIPLVGGKNIRDWASHDTGEFVNDEDTDTVLAWTGTCKRFKRISAYRMLWVNPRPGEPVKAVGFVNRRKCCVPILIGMTAAIRRDPAQAAANLAKAQALLTEARRALEGKDRAQADRLLGEAVDLSPELMQAHALRADLREKAGEEEALLHVYRHWTRANPRAPGPWNRLGELLEKRKDYKGALRAYRRSLEVEWNQPPVIEAKTRMEKMSDR